MVEGEGDAFVVRNAVCVQQAGGAEARIKRIRGKAGEVGNVGACRARGARTAEGVDAVAVHEVVNAVIPVIGDGEGAVGAEGAVDFEIPFLELGRAEQAGRSETRNRSLDLRQGLIVAEAVQQAGVVRRRRRKQIAAIERFARGDIVSGDDEAVHAGCVGSEIVCEDSRKGIVEEAEAAADH